MKICCKCKIEKIYTEFSINKKSKDGYAYRCKECGKQWRIANADKINKQKKQFYKNHRDKLNRKSKVYYELHKTAISDYTRQWHIDNAEHLKQYREQWDIDNPDYKKKYRIDNADKIKKKTQQYRQSEQGKLVNKTHLHKRRMLKLQNTPLGKHFTPADIILKLKLQHDKCIYCETSIKKNYEIDHFIPLSKGGSNDASNIQLLCRECNRTKKAKLPTDYAQEHGKLF